jgi:uncharacterized protein with HEPN domain
MFSRSDRLELILESINIIKERMFTIQVEEDFVATKYGLSILDSVTMRLQTIGENFSKINKEDP